MSVDSPGVMSTGPTLRQASTVLEGDGRNTGETRRVADRIAHKAMTAIAKGKPSNYEGAYDSDDWDAAGDMFPPLVHWKVENEQFVEYELYRCSPQRPLCPSK